MGPVWSGCCGEKRKVLPVQGIKLFFSCPVYSIVTVMAMLCCNVYIYIYKVVFNCINKYKDHVVILKCSQKVLVSMCKCFVIKKLGSQMKQFIILR